MGQTPIRASCDEDKALAPLYRTLSCNQPATQKDISKERSAHVDSYHHPLNKNYNKFKMFKHEIE